MERLKYVSMVISIGAMGVAVYALGSINRNQGRVDTAQEAGVGSRMQDAGSGIFISRNQLGGAGAVELRRGNRLDIFGGLGEGLLGPPGFLDVPPIDYFDLSPIDSTAADLLTAALVAPGTVQPFIPFSVSWEVTGPGWALSRVNSYQLNGGSSGPIFGLSAEPNFTPDGLKAQGSVVMSKWRSGSVRLWAHFGSGIRELEVKEVTMDLSDCSDERSDLALWTTLLESVGATAFVDTVQARAGADVTVTVLQNAVASFSGDGFTLNMKLKLEDSGATLIVDLGMQFMIVPRVGHLGASFMSPGSISVYIDPGLPWYDDAWHTITLGKHNLSGYYGEFRDGLEQLANGFAGAIGRQVRGLPDLDDPDYDSVEAEAPKAVATAIDMSDDQLIVTLCPITGGLVSVSGIFPAAAVKLDPQ